MIFNNLVEILRKISLPFPEDEFSDSDELLEEKKYFAMTRLNSWKLQRPTMCEKDIVM